MGWALRHLRVNENDKKGTQAFLYVVIRRWPAERSFFGFSAAEMASLLAFLVRMIILIFAHYTSQPGNEKVFLSKFES